MAAIFRSANVLYDYAAADYLFRLNLRGQREGREREAEWRGQRGLFWLRARTTASKERERERERGGGNLGKDVCEELTSNFRKSRRNPPRGNSGGRGFRAV